MDVASGSRRVHGEYDHAQGDASDDVGIDEDRGHPSSCTEQTPDVNEGDAKGRAQDRPELGHLTKRTDDTEECALEDTDPNSDEEEVDEGKPKPMDAQAINKNRRYDDPDKDHGHRGQDPRPRRQACKDDVMADPCDQLAPVHEHCGLREEGRAVGTHLRLQEVLHDDVCGVPLEHGTHGDDEEADRRLLPCGSALQVLGRRDLARRGVRRADQGLVALIGHVVSDDLVVVDFLDQDPETPPLLPR
mmetsp:Transcript_119962/g.340074  ORF Transcript_119962/g.340074 Transcript_119962/m.340074 type:complete len:246 (+) Transcript_119962:621-1358(+)